MGGPEGFGGERIGDERPDAIVGGFQVFGGSPTERQQLQDGDEAFFDKIEAELQQIINEGLDE